MKRNLGAEAQVARSLVVRGLFFNLLPSDKDGTAFAVFQVPFRAGDAPFSVYCYVSGQLFVACTALNLLVDDGERLAVLDDLAATPLVRLARDRNSGDTSPIDWVESFTVLPTEPFESTEVVVEPAYAVVGTVEMLFARFPERVRAVDSPRLRVVEGSG